MRTLPFLFLLLFSKGVFATWIDQNTGISDELTGVVFRGDTGLVSGHHGLYYTTSGSGSTNWTRFEIVGNTNDSLRYNHSKFFHCTSDPINGNNLVFACGQDTVSGRAIILSVDLSSLAYTMIYEGPANSLLRHLDFSSFSGLYFASGDEGLMVKFNATTSPSLVSTGFGNDFYGIGFFNNTCWIATEDTILFGTYNSSSFSVNAYPTPGNDHQAVSISNTVEGFSVGSTYYSIGLNNPIQVYTNNNFDFGPLGGRCILFKDNSHFIGTDHGIFRSDSQDEYLEWQPSSQQHRINGFWVEGGNGTDVYACGGNGVLLKSGNNGGPTKPYASVTAIAGGCSGISRTISGIIGSSNNCNWYINGVLEHTFCSNFSRQFPTIGTYQIELFVTNSAGYSDTASHTIHVVPVPTINLPTALTDPILCKDQAAEITIPQSEPNVSYTLCETGNFPDCFGTSATSNGGSLTFSSLPLPESGTYRLIARNTLAPCSASFTDQISITVEQTTASFHSGIINAEAGEVVNLHENSRDAQSFQWTFGSGASIAASTLPAPSLSFSQLGQEVVQLMVSSANGCHDTITGLGSNVYQAAANPDSCWTLVNKGVDPTWTGFYYPDISHLVEVSDGFLASGFFDSTEFASTQGISYTNPVKSGGYLAKYTPEGVIKWVTYSKQTKPNVRENVDFIAADSIGDIYIAGNTEGAFFDNAGDSVSVADPNVFDYRSYLNKLNSQGELIWTLKSTAFMFKKVFVAPDQTILVIGESPATWLNTVILNRNGVNIDTLDFSVYPPGTGPNKSIRLIRLSPTGEVLWYSAISPVITFNSSQPYPIIQFDEFNHFYLAGNISNFFELYSAGSLIPTSIPNINVNRFFLAQYSVDSGQVEWVTHSTTTNGASNYRMTTILDMTTSETGETYLVGSNGSNIPTQNWQHIFFNPDSTITSSTEGPYFLAKINSQGVCEWIRGNRNSQSGGGVAVSKQGSLITTIGLVAQSTGDYVTTTFSSTSGDSLTATIGKSDFFAARYDTDGNLISLAINGDNGYIFTMTYHFRGFFQMDDGSYYLGRNIRFFSGFNNYENFGTVIDTAFGADGTITRFYPECGTLYSVCDPSTPTQMALAESACGSYISPSGMILTQSGLYQDTIQYLTGCDTVFSIDLSILPSTAFAFSDTSCTAYVAPSGAVYSTSGTYIDTLTNAMGCDSLLTIHLTVSTPDSTFFLLSSCNPYLSPGGQLWETSGLYTDTLLNISGCDSVLTVDFTLLASDSLSFQANSCEAYLSPGGQIWTASGTYEETFTNEQGCDSSITIFLTIDSLDLTVVALDTSLIANDSSATYQWLDCTNGYQIIAGATFQTFQPDQSGSYAVSLTQGACTDTSDCTQIVLVNSVADELAGPSVQVVPNPTAGSFTLLLSEPVAEMKVKISDLQGKTVFQQAYRNRNQQQISTALPAGMYLIHLDMDHQTQSLKLLIH